jgi:hypothetical protein
MKKQSRNEAYYGFGETQGGYRYIRLAYAWQGGEAVYSSAQLLYFPFIQQRIKSMAGYAIFYGITHIDNSAI